MNLDDERNVTAKNFDQEGSNKPGDYKLSDPVVARPGLATGDLIASHATETEVIILSCPR
jgi:hypothetical protein